MSRFLPRPIRRAPRGSEVFEYVLIAICVAMAITAGVLIFGKQAAVQMNDATKVIAGGDARHSNNAPKVASAQKDSDDGASVGGGPSSTTGGAGDRGGGGNGSGASGGNRQVASASGEGGSGAGGNDSGGASSGGGSGVGGASSVGAKGSGGAYMTNNGGPTLDREKYLYYCLLAFVLLLITACAVAMKRRRGK